MVPQNAGRGREAGPGRPGESLSCKSPSAVLACLLVADTGHTMKLALLPWILTLLWIVPGPGLTAGMSPRCPSDPSSHVHLPDLPGPKQTTLWAQRLSIWKSIWNLHWEVRGRNWEAPGI